MRNLVLGTLIGFLVAATAAFAYDVTFPAKLRVQAHALVDELGNVLLGSTPAKVEVTNLPLPATGEPWSVTVGLPYPPTVPFTPVAVTTVPLDRILVITDLDGSWVCANWCELQVGSETRLVWAGDASGFRRTYGSGVVFGPGESIVWGAGRDTGGSDVWAANKLTLMGRLLPAS